MTRIVRCLEPIYCLEALVCVVNRQRAQCTISMMMCALADSKAIKPYFAVSRKIVGFGPSTRE